MTALSFADQIVSLPPRDTGAPPDGLRYIIATTQRTGSTLLTDALAGTGVAGTPDEWFLAGAHGDDSLKVRFGIRSDADYIDRVIRATATANGAFGTKLFWRQWDILVPRLIAKTGIAGDKPIREILPDLLMAGLGSPLKYVWLRRRNRVAQAISLYRAAHTGVWRSIAGRGDGDSVADRELPFDFRKISAILRRVEDEDLKWKSYFLAYRIAPLMLVYEEFVENYERTIQGVLKFLDLPYEDATIAPPKLERQADDRSREWEERYREEAAEGGQKTMVSEGEDHG